MLFILQKIYINIIECKFCKAYPSKLVFTILLKMLQKMEIVKVDQESQSNAVHSAADISFSSYQVHTEWYFRSSFKAWLTTVHFWDLLHKIKSVQLQRDLTDTCNNTIELSMMLRDAIYYIYYLCFVGNKRNNKNFTYIYSGSGQDYLI